MKHWAGERPLASLVTIGSRGVRLVKRSPRRKNPEPIASGRQGINDLVRWVSHRPDPRHRPEVVVSEERG